MGSCVRANWFTTVSVIGLIAATPAHPQAITTTYTYDALGRVLSAVDSDGRTVKYSYDRAGNRIRLSNGADFQQYAAIFSASSTQGTSGLQSASAMQDGAYGASSTIHVTAAEASPWIQADLGSAKNINNIQIAAANNAALGGAPAQLNGAVVETSLDKATWQNRATVSGVVAGAPTSISLGGVQARYVRLRRPTTGQLAVGDFMLFSAAADMGSRIVAVDDAATTTVGTLVSTAVLANDYALEGGAPVISGFGQGAQGVVAQSGSNLTYAPASNFAGQDSFVYSITNGTGDIASGTVRVTINPAPNNNAPVAVNDTIAASSGKAKTFDPRTNDSDADGDPLQILSVTTPANGAAEVVGGTSIKYTSSTGYTGADSFTYEISDGRGGRATATITVNVTADALLKVIQPATWGSKAIITGSTFEVGMNAYNNFYTNVYVDTPLSTGKHYWEVKLYCGYLAMGAANDVTTARSQGGYDSYHAGTMTESGITWPFAGAVNYASGTPGFVGRVYGFALDADAKKLTISQNGVARGQVNLPATGPYYPHAGMRHSNADVPLSGQTCAHSTSKGEFLLGGSTIYAPPSGFTTLGGSSNVPPVAVTDAVSTAVDLSLTFDPTANDTDADSDALAVTAVSTPSHGAATRNGARTVTYTPAAGYTGSDSFTYQLTDGKGGGATGTINVTVLAAPPVAQNATTTVAYNSTANSLPLSIVGVPTSVAIATPPTKGATSISGTAISYTPTSGQYGADSLTYTASNAAGTSAPATINITIEPPPAPSAADATLNVAYQTAGQITLPITGSATGATIQQFPTKGALSLAGFVATYTPAAGQFGGDTFKYVATGPGGSSAPATVSIAIATPPAPTVSDTTMSVGYQTAGQKALSAAGLFSQLTISQQPTKGSASISGTTATFTPGSGQSGADTFKFVATGPGGTSGPGTVSVSIAAAPAAPTVGPGSMSVGYQSSTSTSLPVSGSWTYLELASPPSYGSVSFSNSTAYYTHTSGTGGVTDSFQYRAVGPGGTSAPASVSVSIASQPLPPAPTVSSTSGSVAYHGSTSISLPVSGNWTSLSVSSSPNHGSVSIDQSTATYTHSSSQGGITDDFSFNASGPGGTSSSANVSVSIGPKPNVAPIASNYSETIYGPPPGNLISWSGNLAGLVSDADGDPLTFTISSATNGASATLTGASVSITGLKIGTTTFSYTVSDGQGHSATGNVTLERIWEP